MPRFWRRRPGPRVTVSPHVMSGATSPGQQVCTGSRPRSTSEPSSTISWHGAALTKRGSIASTCFNSGSLSQASFHPFGGSGSLSIASSTPSSRNAFVGSGSSTPMPSATRFTVPNRLPSTGRAYPLGFSNSSAGPPALSTRSQISVISSRGSTVAATRFSSPRASSWARKSRKSRYFIGSRSAKGNRHADDHVQREAGEDRAAHPAVAEECLEALFAVALADQPELERREQRPEAEADVVEQAETQPPADESHDRQKDALTQHHCQHVVTTEQDGR